MNIAKEILLPNINLEGIVGAALDKALHPAVMQVVADTKNPLDDALAAAILPSLEKALKDEVAKLITKLQE